MAHKVGTKGQVVIAKEIRDRLGIELKPEVLSFSNIPAWLPPFWLAPGKAMAMA